MGNTFGTDEGFKPTSAIDDTDEGFKPTSRFYRQAGCFRAPFIQAFAFLDPLSLCRVEAVHQDRPMCPITQRRQHAVYMLALP